MAQTKENNPAPRAKAPAAPKAAAANGTVPAGEKHTRPTTRRPYYNRRPRRAQQPKEAATPIHIYPLGGLGEVGKNMTVYECNGDMIIVDCGLVFPDSEKTEIHVTTVFDGELDAADVFVSLIAQKYGQNTGRENLAKTQDLGYNKDEVQKNRVPSGLCG